MSKILVTGGAGFVGSNLVNCLISQGHEIAVLDDLSSGKRSLLNKHAKFIYGSVTDENALNSAFEIEPEYVIHLAALFANQNSVDNPERDLAVNGLGSMKVFEWSKNKSVRKVVYVSSSCVYGHNELMVESDNSYYPDTPYAITKLLGERYAQFWAIHHGLDIAIVRLFNVYGPGEFPGVYRNVIPNFIKLALDKHPLTITGTGHETRDFTFVDDTVRGICKVLFGNTAPSEVFNIASGLKSEIIHVANIINEYLNNEAGVLYQPRRPWDTVTNRKANIDKIVHKFGYSPEVDLISGIHKTCDWIKNLNFKIEQ